MHPGRSESRAPQPCGRHGRWMRRSEDSERQRCPEVPRGGPSSCGRPPALLPTPDGLAAPRGRGLPRSQNARRETTRQTRVKSRVSAVRASPASAAAPSLTLTWRVLSRRGVAARHLPSPPLPSGRASPPHPGACSGEGGRRGAGCGLSFARTSQARAPRAAGLHAGAEHGSATAQSSSVGDPRALQPRPGAGREARCAAVRPHRPQWGLLAGGVTCRKPPGWLVRPAG